MGTRNLTCVVKDEKYKVAQYGQWDGYPDGNGLTILSFLRGVNTEKFTKQIQKVRFLSEQEYKEIIDKHTDNGSIRFGGEHDQYWKKHLHHIDRDIGAGVLEYIMNTPQPAPLKNSLSFAGDSLFCEWCYVIDLDCGKFEVYEGFNKRDLQEGERFYGYKTEGNEYKPVALRASFDLDNLPDDEAFVNTFVDEAEAA